MSITKPFTFVSGTYAKSAEVNADFDAAYSQINTNISNITKNANEITNLDNTKANINGNASEVFNVANPTASSHAINKQTLANLTSNVKDCINGYRISKDSGSPNDTILVSKGSCFDSTYAVMLTKTVSTTKQNSTQSANTTYYVYVIGNSAGSSVDILISTSSSNPGLPAGYTVYRQIGYYTTDGSSKIDIINYYGYNSSSPQGIATIVNSYKNGTSWYRIWSDGFIEQGGCYSGSIGQNASVEVTLLKSFKNTNYSVYLSPKMNTGTAVQGPVAFLGGYISATNKFKILNEGYAMSTMSGVYWRACGY